MFMNNSSLPENTGQDDTPECVKVKKAVDVCKMTHFVTKKTEKMQQ